MVILGLKSLSSLMRAIQEIGYALITSMSDIIDKFSKQPVSKYRCELINEGDKLALVFTKKNDHFEIVFKEVK